MSWVACESVSHFLERDIHIVRATSVHVDSLV
jgi:hypothetical protein